MKSKMSSNNSSEKSDKNGNNLINNDNNSKKANEDDNSNEKDKSNNSQTKSQKSNKSLLNILDEKEIFNIPISIGKSNSNSNSNNSKNDSKSDEKSENQENNNEINLNNINENDSDVHPTEGPIGMSCALKDPEEYRHLKSIAAAFFNYQIDSFRDVYRIERDFKAIGEKYTKRLSFNYTERIEKLKKAIWNNYSFLLKIAEPYKNMFKLIKGDSGELFMEPLMVEGKDIGKIRSSLRLFVRDWAAEGIGERNSTYKPILDELKNFYKDRPKKDFEEGIRVLVPGAGLGRLMYEIAKLGFKTQGNEFSYYMLLCSNYIFNNTTKKNEFTLQPFIHTFSNIYDEESPFQKVMIPDENLSEELAKTDTGEMSMVAGEFCRIYKDKFNYFDSTVTCFFIDTANNIIRYVEIIHDILKDGGLWINIGPLLYHYSENENEISIELSWNEVKNVILGYGFEIIKESRIPATYSVNQKTMMERVYNCIFFVAVKKK